MLNTFQSLQLNAQDRVMDSLKLVLKNAKHDTIRCNILNEMIQAEIDDNIWPNYNEQLKILAEKNIAGKAEPKSFYFKHLADALNNIGYLAHKKGDIPKAIDYYHKSLKIQEETGNKIGIAQSLNNFGFIYFNQGDIIINFSLNHFV